METPLPGVSASFAPVIIATAAFVLSHFVLSFGPVRGAIAGRIGEQAFLLLYSLVAVATFTWMCVAYGRAPFEDLWGDPRWARWLSVLVMPVATVMLTCGIGTANPGAIGFGNLRAPDRGPIGIQKITRHPIMMAIALWSALHLITNGDTASLILFGGMLILTFGGIVHIEIKKRAGGGEAWTRFTAASSVVPFAAIIDGRTQVSLGEIGWNRIAAGLVLYVILLLGHRLVVDVPLLPGLFGS
ncbi:MAG: NnrU family protein [Alphaproteobacteria bacterium]